MQRRACGGRERSDTDGSEGTSSFLVHALRRRVSVSAWLGVGEGHLSRVRGLSVSRLSLSICAA